MKIKIEKRTLRLILAFVLVYSYTVYKNKYKKPKEAIRATLEETRKSLSQTLSELVNNAPDINSKQGEVDGLREAIQKAKDEFEILGAQIPRKSQLDRFLHFLTLGDYAQGIEFESIKPAESTSQEEEENKKQKKTPDLISGYKIARYEIRISGGYSGVTNYLNYLDKLSRFATITNVRMNQDFANRSNTLNVIIIYSIMISDDPVVGEGQAFNVKFAGTKKELVSPFQFFKVEEKTVEVMEKVIDMPSYKLSGIISIGNENRAIIDGKFYRLGDIINGSLVKEILKDKVVLETSGVKLELSLVEQGGSK